MSDFFRWSAARGVRLGALAGVLATAVAVPSPAPAFLQQTKLEGTLGTDIGGVWMSVQQILPEFRITYPKPAGVTEAPIEVGPVPADLAPYTGGKATGVSVKSCVNAGFCAEYSVLVGDIIVKINDSDVSDPAAFAKAWGESGQAVLLSIRRPALKMSSVRLVKIKYDGKTSEEGGVSTLTEKLDVQLLDVKLPFADAIEEARRAHTMFTPSDKQRTDLAAGWQDLEPNAPAVFTQGETRVVARASFDDVLAVDPALKDAQIAMLMNLDANPLRGGGGKVIDVYGVENVSKDTLSGAYVTATIASAPFPINIEFKGRFEMTRLGPWSNADDVLRLKKAAQARPKEDLSKFKTLPDVPEPAKSK